MKVDNEIKFLKSFFEKNIDVLSAEDQNGIIEVIDKLQSFKIINDAKNTEYL